MTFKDYIKARILEDIQIEVIETPEEIPVRGNASAIDDVTDREVEQRIHNQLKAGNVWAWCDIEVRGTWQGITHSDYCGACSFEDKKAFASSSCYTDMVNEVAEKIAEDVLAIVNKVME